MWPGAEEWGWTQGRILCSPYFFVKTPGAKDKCIYFTPTSLITLVDKSDCALRKRVKRDYLWYNVRPCKARDYFGHNGHI